ncbi:hypothetical protein YC2023_076713 [Brassica napus]
MRWSPRARVSGPGWPIRCGRVGRYKWYQSQVSHLGSDLRGILRPDVGATRKLRSLRGGVGKRAWAGLVKKWVTYREVIRDTVRVRPKHRESYVIRRLLSVRGEDELVEAVESEILHYDSVLRTRDMSTRIHTRRRTSGDHTRDNAAGKSILKMGFIIRITNTVSLRWQWKKRNAVVVRGGGEEEDDDHRFVVERDGSLTMEEAKTTSVSGSEESRTSARVEAQRVWLELYQIGHLGFGRVSFTGI